MRCLQLDPVNALENTRWHSVSTHHTELAVLEWEATEVNDLRIRPACFGVFDHPRRHGLCFKGLTPGDGGDSPRIMQDEFEEPTPSGTSEGEREKRWSEGVLRETFRKAVEKGIEAGVGTLRSADSVVRGVTQDGRLPKEVISYVFAQIDETKNALVRGVANEVRDFLEATDMAGEFYRALTSLSFEVKTEIRFIPNEAGGVRPQVKARAVQKRSRRKATGRKSKDATPPDAADET